MSDEVAAAVRSLDASRSALAAALASTPSPHRRRRAQFSGASPSSNGLGNVLWDSVSEAAGEHWRHGRVRASLELARPALEDAVRRQPWTAVAVASLCGAVAVWIVSARRRLVFSAARLWWRTAGTAILASAAFKLYERYVAGTDRPASPSDDAAAAAPAPED